MQYKTFPFSQLKSLKQKSGDLSKPTLNYSDYFYHKKTFFELHGGRDYDVVFVGDSITDSAEWEDMFPNSKIANRGIAGDRTDGVLKRLESILSTSAQHAFIMIGINDFFAKVSVDEVFDNYRMIVKELSTHGMKVYIQSTVFAGVENTRINSKIVDLNARLRLLAENSSSITYIDLNHNLAESGALKSIYSRDSIHLNGGGYGRWKETISPYMLSISREDNQKK